MKTFQFGIALGLGLVGLRVEASNYPPGYAIERSCQTQGPVEVCAVNQHYGNYPRLNIYYKGHLLGEESSSEADLSAWIQLNGRRGEYPLSVANQHASLLLNEPISYFCWVGGVPEWYQGPYAGCQYPATHHEPDGSMVWEVSPIPQSQIDLFFYARNQYGLANAWDIELAIVSGDGKWDSNLGQNYRFRFE